MEDSRDYAQELHRIFIKHKPNKIKKIKSLLTKYRGREAHLLAKVREKYGLPDQSKDDEPVHVVVRVRPKVKADRSSDVEVVMDLQRAWCRIVASSGTSKTSIDAKDHTVIELLTFFRTYPGLRRQIGGQIALFIPAGIGDVIRINHPNKDTHKVSKFGFFGNVFGEGCSQKMFYDRTAAHIVDSVLQGQSPLIFCSFICNGYLVGTSHLMKSF